MAGMRVSEQKVRNAVRDSRSWAETLRRLGYCTTGNNRLTIKKYVGLWGISTEHFDPDAVRSETLRRVNQPTPLSEILVVDSTYSRGHLKERLYAEALKEPRCELCGQSDRWHGRTMSMILDHENGIRNDHRLENLRILCPNCAATLDTHCGRNIPRLRRCPGCDEDFVPKSARHRFCSRNCFREHRRRMAGRPDRSSTLGIPIQSRRKVERPPHEQLMAEVERLGYLAVGRKYGVSDTAIRKWIRQYERERALARQRSGHSRDPDTNLAEPTA